MRFEIRPAADRFWHWVLRSEAGELLAESHRTFPTPAAASAAALAWSQIVHRAGRDLARRPGASLL